eukprot:scaffold17494_cov103-Isochrysis_galbana.AAC.3
MAGRHVLGRDSVRLRGALDLAGNHDGHPSARGALSRDVAVPSVASVPTALEKPSQLQWAEQVEPAQVVQPAEHSLAAHVELLAKLLHALLGARRAARSPRG